MGIVTNRWPEFFDGVILLPDICFTVFPYGLTLEGQYIVKNLFLLCAALVVGSTVRHQQEEKRLM